LARTYISCEDLEKNEFALQCLLFKENFVGPRARNSANDLIVNGNLANNNDQLAAFAPKHIHTLY